jgi:hypothetical protein
MDGGKVEHKFTCGALAPSLLQLTFPTIDNYFLEDIEWSYYFKTTTYGFDTVRDAKINPVTTVCNFRTLIFNIDKELHDSLQSLTRNTHWLNPQR